MNLNNRFKEFTKNSINTEKVFFELIGLYNEKNRHYHNLSHIENSLDLLDKLVPAGQDVDMIEAAIWWHDAIYSTRLNNNEQLSSDLFSLHNSELRLFSNESSRIVESLIISTATHMISRGDYYSTKYFLDIDMAILGSSPEQYLKYASNIRKEYNWVSEELYSSKRKFLLKSLLNKSRIYYTNEFYNKFEISARRNIQSEFMVL